MPVGDPAAVSDVPETVDGGDRACGDLLLVLAHRVRLLASGTPLRLVATDPAAAIDLPAWCHLTGHRYLGAGQQPDGRPHYDLRIAADSHRTRPGNPWRLQPTTSAAPPTGRT